MEAWLIDLLEKQPRESVKEEVLYAPQPDISPQEPIGPDHHPVCPGERLLRINFD